MDWLTAILAFATTMLIFSVIVTTLVETAHRSYGARARGLWNMLDRFYDEVIVPYHKDTDFPATPKEKFLQKMTENRVDTAKETKKPLMNVKGTYLDYLPVEMFMERLASTEFSKILPDDEELKEDVLKDVAQKFENFGLDASLKFQQWARVLSIGFSVLVAIIFYVHPHVLISTYIENPKIAEQVALKSDAAVDSYEKLKAEIAKFESESLSKELKEPDKVDIKKAVDELKTEIDKARKDVAKLSEAGAPLGWPEEFKKDDWKARICKLPFTDWLWLLLGALLIGLGAPFWAQVVTSLMQIRNVQKSVKSILTPEQAPANLTAATGGATTKSMPVKAFTVGTAMPKKNGD